MEKKATYLYGAAVQGIQSFIFQSNKLKYIVGASALVDQICRAEFDEFATAGELIVQAAGNIKCIFNDRADCEKAVRRFPKKIMELAPGVTISQAVVKYDATAENSFATAVDELEARLKIQRNRPVSCNAIGLMGVVRSRTSGLPAVDINKEGEFMDEAAISKMRNPDITKKLCYNCFGIELKDKDISYQIDEISSKNNWIAIIHADGNGLGKILQRIGRNKDKLKVFSSALDDCTVKAAQDAYNSLDKESFPDKIPIRPIILGGDDFTMVCRADIAIEYVKQFLKAFEKRTQHMLSTEFANEGIEKLTACGGIAFVKSSYPFHYGYKLAEQLCRYAKDNAAKEDDISLSCLMFHKVQDSLVDTYEQIRQRELVTADSISLCYGPYYLHTGQEENIDNLQTQVGKLGSSNKNDKNHLREWLEVLYANRESARQKMEYRKKVLVDPEKDFLLEWTNLEGNKTPVYDILSLSSIMNGSF